MRMNDMLSIPAVRCYAGMVIVVKGSEAVYLYSERSNQCCRILWTDSKECEWIPQNWIVDFDDELPCNKQCSLKLAREDMERQLQEEFA